MAIGWYGTVRGILGAETTGAKAWKQRAGKRMLGLLDSKRKELRGGGRAPVERGRNKDRRGSKSDQEQFVHGKHVLTLISKGK